MHDNKYNQTAKQRTKEHSNNTTQSLSYRPKKTTFIRSRLKISRIPWTRETCLDSIWRCSSCTNSLELSIPAHPPRRQHSTSTYYVHESLIITITYLSLTQCDYQALQTVNRICQKRNWVTMTIKFSQDNEILQHTWLDNHYWCLYIQTAYFSRLQMKPGLSNKNLCQLQEQNFMAWMPFPLTIHNIKVLKKLQLLLMVL